ncbi:MAG: hypothetical protein IPI95_12635 [Flavobacteriales bacterium]|nr:hypothetical protein [Flavobacteriales bacterium]
MHSTYCSFIALLLLGTSACTTPAPKGPVSNGDVVISVFDTCHVRFDTAWKKGEAPDTYGLLRLDAGRVVMTKITVPHFDKRVDVHLRMRLVSLGDPWDKAGSLFILPGADLPLFQQVENGTLPMDTTGYPGVVAQAGYAPAIELLRFMTPFGIGHFSDTARVRPPIYVPQWEKSVTWEADITPLLSALEGEVWLGCYIDTWTKEGFSITVELTFDESDIAGDLVRKQQVLPLCNMSGTCIRKGRTQPFTMGRWTYRSTCPTPPRMSNCTTSPPAMVAMRVGMNSSGRRTGSRWTTAWSRPSPHGVTIVQVSAASIPPQGCGG